MLENFNEIGCKEQGSLAMLVGQAGDSNGKIMAKQYSERALNKCIYLMHVAVSGRFLRWHRLQSMSTIPSTSCTQTVSNDLYEPVC